MQSTINECKAKCRNKNQQALTVQKSKARTFFQKSVEKKTIYYDESIDGVSNR